MTSSKRWFGQRATSPAATTPGAAVQVASHTTPLSIVRPEPSSQSVLGPTPMPTTDQVDVEHRAVGEPDPLDAVAALDEHHADAEAHVHAVVAVEVGDDRRPSRRRAPRSSGTGSASTRRHLDPAAPAGGRHLRADEAGADHRHPPR